MKKLMTIAVIAAMLVSCGSKQSGKPDFSDNEYAVRTIGASNADLQTTYPATFKGVQDVEIRPKVAGFITKIYVHEGQAVNAGQPLFEIDCATYKAAVNQAQAAVNAALSQVNTAKLTFDNAKQLLEKNVIGQYEYDTRKNTYETALASLAQAKASLVSAKEMLGFCHIAAPTSGVVGSLPYKVGALVSSGSVQALTTISNGSNVEVYFSLTEKDMLELCKTNGSAVAAISAMPAIKLQLADGSVYAHEGRVTKASGVIDPSTGTINLIANFPNPDRLLKSGGSGHVIMPHVATDAVIIPQESVVEIQDKYFIYIVGKDNKVKYTEITIDPNNDGQNYIVTSGLRRGDRIVVQGVTSLKDGMEIKPLTEAEYAKKLKKTEELGKIQGDGVITVGKALTSKS